MIGTNRGKTSRGGTSSVSKRLTWRYPSIDPALQPEHAQARAHPAAGAATVNFTQERNTQVPSGRRV
jgi:hypothetical protein